MAPIREGIHIPFIWESFDANGKLKNNEFYEKSAEAMFNQLVWWAEALMKARS